MGPGRHEGDGLDKSRRAHALSRTPGCFLMEVTRVCIRPIRIAKDRGALTSSLKTCAMSSWDALSKKLNPSTTDECLFLSTAGTAAPQLFGGDPVHSGWMDGARLGGARFSRLQGKGCCALNPRGRGYPSLMMAPPLTPAPLTHPPTIGLCVDPSGNVFLLDHGDITPSGHPPGNASRKQQYCLLRRIDGKTGEWRDRGHSFGHES